MSDKKTREDWAHELSYSGGYGFCPQCKNQTVVSWGGRDRMNVNIDCDGCFAFKCFGCGWKTEWIPKKPNSKKRKSTHWYLDLDKFEKCIFCERCGVSEKDKPHMRFEVDHIRPVCDGGTDQIENLQCLCSYCHAVKTADDERMRMVREVMKARAGL